MKKILMLATMISSYLSAETYLIGVSISISIYKDRILIVNLNNTPED
jgi:hypothetical protein